MPYQSHNVDLSGWAQILAPRDSEMAIEGMRQGIQLQDAVDTLRHNQEMRPIQIAKAKIEADAMASELERFKILNSRDLLQTQAKRLMYEERKRVYDAEQSLQTQSTLDQFNALAAQELPAMIQRGDTDAIADFFARAQDEFGPDYYRTAESPYSWDKVLGMVREEERQRLQQQKLYMASGKQQLKQIELADRVQEISQNIINMGRNQEDASILDDFTGMPVDELAAGGETKSKLDTLNTGMQNFAKAMIAEIDQDPSAAGYREQRHFFEAMADTFEGASASKYGPIRRLGKDKDVFAARWRWENLNPFRNAANLRTERNAQAAAARIRDMAKRMDSKNPKEADAARQAMKDTLMELRTYSSRRARDETMRIRLTRELRRLEDAQLQYRQAGQMPTIPTRPQPQLPAVPPAGVFQTREDAPEGGAYNAPDGTIRIRRP